MTYREERTFVVELHLSAEFGDDYEGEDDGYAWFERWDRLVRPRVVRAVFEALASDPGWKVIPSPRGLDPSTAIEIGVERISR